MTTSSSSTLEFALHELKHLLPTQGPLKDFIHHNTLHAFQHLPFHKGIEHCSRLTGSKVYMSKSEYLQRLQNGDIDSSLLNQELGRYNLQQKLQDIIDTPLEKNISLLRSLWKSHFQFDIDGKTHPFLFRILCGYLDQGISVWKFPAHNQGFLYTLRELDKNSFISLLPYGTSRARQLLQSSNTTAADVLRCIVGNETLHGHYVFDQQFSHPGWSGLVSVLEDQSESLIEAKKISLIDLVLFELILELDVLDFTFGSQRKTLDQIYKGPSLKEILTPRDSKNEFLVLKAWHEAFEKTYYNTALRALQAAPPFAAVNDPQFQAVFCIDDRECSLRRYIEQLHPQAETFGTPGFFGVEFFYQPENSFHVTKLCPAPVTPKYLIKQT
ncbi:DUF2309 domain-containing protein, partial [bacterium]|nr:DUF2309 domain-containing protein [bacterium]